MKIKYLHFWQSKYFVIYVLKNKVVLFFNSSSSRRVFEVELRSQFHCL